MEYLNIIIPLITTGAIGFLLYLLGFILIEGARFPNNKIPTRARDLYLFRALSFLEYISFFLLIFIIGLLYENRDSYLPNIIAVALILILRVLLQFSIFNEFVYHEIMICRLEYLANGFIFGGAIVACYLHLTNLKDINRFIVYFICIYTFYMAFFTKALWAERKTKIITTILFKDGRRKRTLELLDEKKNEYIFAGGENTNIIIPKDTISELKIKTEQDELGYKIRTSNIGSEHKLIRVGFAFEIFIILGIIVNGIILRFTNIGKKLFAIVVLILLILLFINFFYQFIVSFILYIRKKEKNK
jgi:hypothetical protein